MAKVIALILVVITVVVLLVPAADCTNKRPTGAGDKAKFGSNNAKSPQAFVESVLESAAECKVNIDKCITETNSYIRKALDGVVAAALQEKRTETEEVTLVQSKIVADLLVKAKATGDMDKVAAVSFNYRRVADEILQAPPAEKYLTMEVAFQLLADPSA